ncbi:MAG TPA: hypothetical protein VLA49_05385 [Anaerolineales bacterium]|nr:hypothetical protein [Anaerolineales bacterium]
MKSTLSGMKTAILLVMSVLLILSGSPRGSHAVQAAPLPQEGLLACSGEGAFEPGAALCQDIQVLFIIDDSGSMRTNDPIQARFAGVENTVDILGEVYLQALEAQSRSLPKIFVSAIHFAGDVDLRTGWVPIDPADRQAWESGGADGRAAINQILVPDTIRNLRLTSLRTTNFTDPFNQAVELFKTAPPTEAGCSNRIVLVLTDGAPDLGRGPLTGDQLENHFEDVKASAAELKELFGSLIYVSGLNDETRLADYWSNSEAHWQEIAPDSTSGDLLGAVKIEDTVDESGQPVGKLAVLRDRIQAIIEQSIGLQGESVVGTEMVPPYLEFLRISYFAPNANATLNVFGPDGSLIEIDDETVTLEGAGTPDQVIKILNPEPGQYRFEPSIPGGRIRLLFSYPSLEESLPLQLKEAVFQQYTESTLSFELLDKPASLPDYPLGFEMHFTSPGEEAEPIPLTEDGGGFQFPFLPLTPGDGEVFVDVFTQNKDGQDCLLHRSELAGFEVEEVLMVARPVDELVCTPSGMPIRFPIELQNGRTNARTTISLPVEWQVEAVHENESPVQASVEPTGDDGLYTFSLSTEVAGRVTTSVTASVSHDSYSAVLFEDTFETTRLLQDRFYAFELTGVGTRADDLSIRFNQWFNRVSLDPASTLLMGRKWFDWPGHQRVQVSGRFFDKVSGEGIAGIERYQVSLVPVEGGEPVVTSNNWQEGGDGEYTVLFTAPPLGTYQVVVADVGETAACVQVDPPGTGPSITLINHYWEYLIWILLILLILILVILLTLWLLCCNRGPLTVFLSDDDEMVNAPTHKASHRVASLTAQTPLRILEEAAGARAKIGQEGEWLLVATQVVGYVLEKHVRQDAQPVLNIPKEGVVEVHSGPAADSEMLLKALLPAPVMLLERAGEWLKVQVTVAAYVEAHRVQQPAQSAFWLRCRHRPLLISLIDSYFMNDAPTFEGAHEIASLKPYNALVVLEDEAIALEKIEQKEGWLLVQTRVPGYVQSSCVQQGGQAVVHVEPGDLVEVYEQPHANSNSVMGLSHPVQVTVLEQAGDWLKVEVLAAGYVEALLVKPPVRRRISCRKDRPKIKPRLDSFPVQVEPRTDESKPEEKKKDDLKIIEGIGPVVEGILRAAGITTFAELAGAESRIEEIQARLDEAGYYYMYPNSWPEQARLAAAGDWEAFQALKEELKRGRPQEPDEAGTEDKEKPD